MTPKCRAASRSAELSLALALLLALPAGRAAASVLKLPMSRTTEELSDYSFAVTLGIGTPPKPFRLIVDTGSSNLWVVGPDCKSDDCAQRNRYNPALSSTSRVVPDSSFILPYLDSTAVAAEAVSDVISLPAGATKNGVASLPAANASRGAPFVAHWRQDFGAATDLMTANTSSGTWQSFDGIIGMGLPRGSERDMALPVLAMYQQGVIDAPMFGLFLRRDASAPQDGGELTLGGYDAARIQGKVTWVDVLDGAKQNPSGSWIVPVDAVSLELANGSSIPVPGACTGHGAGGKHCAAILDSGSSTTVGPLEAVAALHRALGAKATAEMRYPCKEVLMDVTNRSFSAIFNPDDPDQSTSAFYQVCRDYRDQELEPELAVCRAVQFEFQEMLTEAEQLPRSQRRKFVNARMAQMQSKESFCAAAPLAVEGVEVDCDRVAKLPAVAFTIGGQRFSISPLLLVDEYEFSLKAIGTHRKVKACRSRILGHGEMPQGTWLLGHTFLGGVYSIHAYSQRTDDGTGAGGLPRVGLAQLRQPAAAAANASAEGDVAGAPGAARPVAPAGATEKAPAARSWAGPGARGCWGAHVAALVAVALSALL